MAYSCPHSIPLLSLPPPLPPQLNRAMDILESVEQRGLHPTVSCFSPFLVELCRMRKLDEVGGG